MPWSKEMQESYALQQKIRRHMIDCVICECPITPKDRDENNGMCRYCYKMEKGG